MRMMINVEEYYPIYHIVTTEGFKEKNADAIVDIPNEEYQDLLLQEQVMWDMFRDIQLKLKKYYDGPKLEPYSKNEFPSN